MGWMFDYLIDLLSEEIYHHITPYKENHYLVFDSKTNDMLQYSEGQPEIGEFEGIVHIKNLTSDYIIESYQIRYVIMHKFNLGYFKLSYDENRYVCSLSNFRKIRINH